MQLKTTSEDLYQWIQKTDSPALIGLVIANIVPLILTFVFRWDVGGIVILYWWENVIIGFYAVLRLLGAQGKGDDETGGTEVAEMANHSIKLFLVPFFCFHYFFFCFIHGIFVLLLTSGDFESARPMDGNLLVNFWNALPTWGALSLLIIFVSHGISFFRYYIRGREYVKTHAIIEMFRPYGRIVLLHICILAGGFATMLFGQPIVLVVLLILGKTAMDAGIHIFFHRPKEPS